MGLFLGTEEAYFHNLFSDEDANPVQTSQVSKI
jgi:hypothetical protein